MLFLHYCIACAKAGTRVWGAFGFPAWPAIEAHSICAGGSVWACEEHRDDVSRRSANGGAIDRDDHPPPGNPDEQPKPAAGRGIRPPAHDHEQGSLEL